MKELWNKVQKLWASFRAWKYSNIALWSAAGVAVAAVAVVIVLCAVGPKGNDNPTLPTGGSSMDGTNPTGGDSTDNGGSNNGGSTDNNGGPTDNNNGGSTDNNNGGSSDNNNGGSTGNNNGGSSDNNNGGSSSGNNGGSSSGNNGGSSGNNNGGSTGNTNTDNVNSSTGESVTAGELKFYKTSTHSASKTVNPGKNVSYSIVVTNNGSSKQTVTVTDEIPAVAEYVSGCDKVSGNQLKWEFSLDAKASKTITYTLKAKNDEANLGKTLDGAAKVNGTAVPFHKIYIERTMGNEDQRIMETAIDAFRQYTSMKDLNLLKMIYYVACSKSVSYNDSSGNVMTPAALLNQVYSGGSGSGSTSDGEEANAAAVKFRNAVIPTLYGGKGATAAQLNGLKGVQATKVTADGLMAGDIILVQESSSDSTGKLYIYNGQRLFQLGDGVIDVDTGKVLGSLPNAYRYAGLRLCMVMTDRISYKDELTDTLTDAQKAVIATAEALVLRGDRGQYDASSLMKPDSVYEYKTNTPEDYTSDSWKYSNCANLTFDAYYFGLGYDGGGNWYTANIINTAKKQNIFYKEPTGNETAEQQKAMRDEFFSTLQPGDVICIRRANNSGHALLYIGNGKIIHSTGGSYKVASGTQSTGIEQYEATFRYLNAECFFEEKCDTGTAYTYYLFCGKVTKIGIYRPMNYFKGSVPQESVNRMNNLQDIVVEKVASKAMGQTINVGDEMTYTFRFLNASNASKTLDVTDVLPAGTTLVSASGWTVSGSNLSCKVTIPAGEKKEISYTVKVGSNVPNNKIESKSAKVGGVSVRSSDIFVAKTLTSAQQQAIINAVKSLSTSSKTGLELANEIYKVALGVDKVFEHTTLSTFHSQLVVDNALADNQYGAMAAPSLYGGRNFQCEDDGKHGRLVKMAREDHLIVGDIIFGRTSSTNNLFIYLGDGICWSLTTNKIDTYNSSTVHVNTRLEYIFGYKNYWAILRPSMNMG